MLNGFSQVICQWENVGLSNLQAKAYGPGVAGALFGGGWWFWVDAVAASNTKVSFVQVLFNTFQDTRHGTILHALVWSSVLQKVLQPIASLLIAWKGTAGLNHERQRRVLV